jgi:aquaglyceroporin related protein, other eukaryote
MSQPLQQSRATKSKDFASDGPETEFKEDLRTIPTESSAGTGTAGVAPHKTSSGLQKTRSALGLHPAAPILHDHDIEEYQKLWWSKVKIALREPFAEFFGVMIMVMFGDGSVAQVLLSTGQTTAPGGNGFGAYQSISWG